MCSSVYTKDCKWITSKKNKREGTRVSERHWIFVESTRKTRTHPHKSLDRLQREEKSAKCAPIKIRQNNKTKTVQKPM